MPPYGLGKKAASPAQLLCLVSLILTPCMLRADPFLPDEPAPLVEVPLPQSMDVTQRDSHNWVTLECGISCGHRVVRQTLRYADGGKSQQMTRVLSLYPGAPPLYVRTDKWNHAGGLVFSEREVDTLSDSGARVAGNRDTQNLAHGRIVKDTRETWNVSMKSWLVTFSKTVRYYADGDMKERIMENIPADRKTDEHWGPKGPMGRVKTVRRWNASTQAWQAWGS